VAKTNLTLLASALTGWWGRIWCSEECARQPPFGSTFKNYSFGVAPCSANTTIFI